MALPSEFVTYVVEQLAPLGDVQARRMFGGYGLYLDSRMFALVAADTLYFKTDDENRAEFEAAGLTRFRPDSTRAEMPYFVAPAAAIDERETLCAWARKGVEAAARAAQKHTRQTPRRRAK